MNESSDDRIRIMRIIARMNVGGPAVQVSGLMRGFDSSKFDQRLVTGYCNPDESDYLDTVATDVVATRINGFGRSISPKDDLLALLAIVKEIRTQGGKMMDGMWFERARLTGRDQEPEEY